MGTPDLKVLFVAGFGPITRTPADSRAFYKETLGLPLEPMPGDDRYLHGAIEGVKHFGIWPLDSAAESCFGTSEWPKDVPTPNAWIEYDVEDVRSASQALRERGYRLLVDNRVEPWGQTVTRLLSPEGVLVGVTITPWMRK
jgi:catechol 2,3-dioxygenase-like lactoylglutathione lyase family enzyme